MNEYRADTIPTRKLTLKTVFIQNINKRKDYLLTYVYYTTKTIKYQI